MKNNIFAKGVGFQKLFIMFVIGCIFGTYYEMILNFVKVYIRTGEIYWSNRSGVIYGPFSIIYGLGCLAMTFFLCEKKYTNKQILLYGGILGGIVEYFIGWLQEVLLGSTSWDYSPLWLDIDGRTTIPIMFFWGLICLGFVRLIYPTVCKITDKIPYKQGTVILNICFVLLMLDIFISYSALIRQHLRWQKVKPFTPYGEFLDRTYPDERLAKAFPGMVKIEKEE